MKKIFLVILFINLMLLTACYHSDFTSVKQVNKKENINMSLVHGKNINQSKEVIDYVEKILKSNLNLGVPGTISLNYADATNSDGLTTYALFLVTNRTADTLEKDFEFIINWSYDGYVIYKNQKVLYQPLEYGILEPNTTAIMFLPLPTDSIRVVENMTDNSKISLSISDLMYVEE